MADRVFSYEFRGKFDNLTAGFTAAGRSAQDFGGKLTALDKQGAKMRAGLDALGGVAGKIGLVAAAGLGAAVLKAADFDAAMSNIQAATHETADGMDALREAALEAGARTAFSATEAAGAIENLAKAGVSTKDILGGGLSGALDLAAAGELDVASAAEIAATALTQFNLAGADVPHVADLLAAGAGKAQGEVSDLSQALNQSGLVASQTGLSIEETVGTLSAFASAGLLGSDAGTSFKTMLQSLTPTSKQAAELMSELGISAYDAQGNFIGMADFAGVLQAALADMTVEQQNATLKTIFGSDAVRAASVLYSQGAEGIGDWTNKVDDAGYAAETAALKMDNLKGDWEEFTGALETALIGAGDGSQGPLRSLVQGATDAVNAFNKLPPAAQNTATALLGVTAVLGGGLWFGAKVIGGIANTKQALDDLGISAGKTGTAVRGLGKAVGIAGIALAGLAIGEAIQKQADESLPGLEELKSRLLDLAAVGITANIGNEFDSLGDSISRLADKTKFDAINDSLANMVGFGHGTSFREATAEIELLDQALTGLVTSGHADLAAKSLNLLAEQQDLSGSETEKLTSLLSGYGESLVALENEATLAAGAQGELGAAGAVGAGGMEQSAEAAKAAAEALQQAREAATGTAQEFFNLGDGLNDASVSLGDWLTQMSEQAQALREFRMNAQDAAENGLNQGLIKSLHEAGPEGALRMKQLADASEAEIRRANRVWREGQREIAAYTDEVGGVPDAELDADGAAAAAEIARVQAKLDKYGLTVANGKAALNDVASGRIKAVQGLIDKYGMTKREATALLADKARPVIDAIKAALNDLDGKTATTYVVTKRSGSTSGMGPQTESADGSTVPKTGLPYADRHPYLLADGEEVISNRHGQADRWRPLLKAINYGRLAEGGTAGMAGFAFSGWGARGRNTPALSGLSRLDRQIALTERALNQATRAIEQNTGNRKREISLTERAAKINEKLLDLQQERTKAELDHLKALKDSRRSLVEDVAAKFKTSTLGGDYTYSRDWGELVSPERAAELNAFMGQAAIDSAPYSAMTTLQNDIKEAQEAARLLRRLSKSGLNGAAYENLAREGTLEELRAYAALSKRDLDTYERLYNQREKVTRATGAVAGDVMYAQEIRKQSRVLEQSRNEQRATNRELKETNRRLDRLEKAADRAADKVGDKINGASKDAKRKGTR